MRALVIAALVLFSAAALAQGYPNKPLRLVVGYPPGGSIASEFVAKSAPDGYTLLNQGNHAINRNLYKDLGYDQKDFIPVCRVAVGTTILVVNNDTPFRNLQDLVSFAKANPGKLFSASAGFGSAPHLASVAFESAAGIKFTTVQYKGGGPASVSLLAGDTQVMFATSPTVTGFIKGGRMRPLVVSMRKSSPAIPGIPGSEEAGMPFESTFWFGLYVPAGTAPEIVQRLHAVAAKGLARQEIRDRIAQQGMDASPSASPEAFAAEIAAEAPVIERSIRESGAKVE